MTGIVVGLPDHDYIVDEWMLNPAVPGPYGDAYYSGYRGASVHTDANGRAPFTFRSGQIDYQRWITVIDPVSTSTTPMFEVTKGVVPRRRHAA